MKNILNQGSKAMKRMSNQMDAAAMKNTSKNKVSKSSLKKIAAVVLSILIGGSNGVLIQTALQAIIQIGSSPNAYGEIAPAKGESIKNNIQKTG
jgi:hypothetical protein